jgi:hypothetical protein
MVEARHFILFPSADLDRFSGIIEQPESFESVEKLAKACRPGDVLIIPKVFVSRFDKASELASDGHWALVRNP